MQHEQERIQLVTSFDPSGSGQRNAVLQGHDAIDLSAILKTNVECGSNDISLQFVEFSNVHNCDRSCNVTRSNLVYKFA